jgi:glycosyltransferase involved in cell wall biosynthesis
MSDAVLEDPGATGRASAHPQPPARPVFAFLAFTSGSYEGAIIRDMRLANELHRRGFKVHVYWMMEQNPELVDPGIAQRVLVRGLRYQFKKPSGILDTLAKGFSIVPAARRRLFVNEHPEYVARILGNLVRVMCDGGRSDLGLIDRLEKFLIRDGVSHLLPTFAWTCPIAQRVRERGRAKFEYLPTFQGEEIFAHFAMRIGRIGDYHRVLREVMAGSPWPAVAVSRDYIERLSEEMGLDASRMRAIYPGVELPREIPFAEANPARDADFAALKTIFPSLAPELPIVTYLGRQDPEKGIDLLLYAVRMLADRGVKIQLACVGGSSFGLQYRKSCEAIAEHLRLTVFWKGRVSNELRAALFRRSRCVVYPSIHREPFGMVAAEAMSYGTPVIVPDLGGITEVIESDGRRAGLTFAAWETTSLAEQLGRLVRDDALRGELASNARSIAEQFAVTHMADQVLAHMDLATIPPTVAR